MPEATVPLQGVATYDGETRGRITNTSGATAEVTTVSDIRLTLDFGSNKVVGSATNFRFGNLETGSLVVGPLTLPGLPAHTFLNGGSVDFDGYLARESNGYVIGDIDGSPTPGSWIAGNVSTTITGAPLSLGSFSGALFGPSSDPQEMGLTFQHLLGSGYYLVGGAALGRSSFVNTSPPPRPNFYLAGGRPDNTFPMVLPSPLLPGCVFAACLSAPTEFTGPYVRRTVQPGALAPNTEQGFGDLKMLIRPAILNPSGIASYTLRNISSGGEAVTTHPDVQTTLVDVGYFATNGALRGTDVDRIYLFDVSTALSQSLDYVQVAGYERMRPSNGLELGFFAYGQKTPTADMPSVGAAVYNGGTRGVYYNGVNTYATVSDISMNVNFASGSISGEASNFRLANIVSGSSASIPLGFTFSGASHPDRNSFSAVATATGEWPIAGHTAPIRGEFFGTGANAASEAGLTYNFFPSGSDTYMMGAAALGRAP